MHEVDQLGANTAPRIGTSERRPDSCDGGQHRYHQVVQIRKVSKHVDIRHHFVKDESLRGTIAILHCRSEEMLADLMTKRLTAERVHFLREALYIDDIVFRSEVKESVDTSTSLQVVAH